MKNIVSNMKHVKKIVYVTSMGVLTPTSFITLFLNTITNMTLKWKLEAENLLRTSGIPYLILRPGGLVNKRLSEGIIFEQNGKVGGRTSREDVAEACLESVERDVDGSTFEIYNGDKNEKTDYDKQFMKLEKDKTKIYFRNHYLPIYILYGLFWGSILFIFKKYVFKF
jgi:nucleoside-diphosphate-sugar epimerase